MQDSKLSDSYALAAKMFLSLFLCSGILLWLYHSSLNLYYQQKYHDRSPLESWDESVAWRAGTTLTQAVLAAKEAFLKSLSTPPASETKEAGSSPSPASSAPPSPLPEPVIPAPLAPPETPAPPVAKKKDRTVRPLRPESSQSSQPPQLPQTQEKVALSANDRVFFVGDSMMQGVAPHAMSFLYKRFSIRSINLSKQGTGLTYLGLFNWLKEIETTLDQYPDIRLMVVMLGPNDPWDMVVKKEHAYIPFRSKRWNETYRARVEQVLTLAASKNVRVIWIAPPHMRDQRLSEGMQYLGSIYEQEVRKNQQIYINANELLGYDNGDFSDYMMMDNKKVKIRTDDGIHFTQVALRHLANAILAQVDAPRSLPKTAQSQ